ncbi:hypothetical protein ONZ45_g17160 [Pleurotus djamor]|nr:hypothetical protein ONZ45_g17160 [Pleurotus djamor]
MTPNTYLFSPASSQASWERRDTKPSTAERLLAQKAAAAASENELDIKANLAMLNRRVFSLRRTKIRSEVAGLPDLPEDATKPPSKFVCVVMMKPSEQKTVDDIIKWYDGEHMDLFARTPGWIRGRLYELVAGPMEGAGKPDPTVSPNLSVTFLALHEFSTVEGIGGQEMIESVSTPWAKEVVADVGPNLEQRLFGYYSQFVKET